MDHKKGKYTNTIPKKKVKYLKFMPLNCYSLRIYYDTSHIDKKDIQHHTQKYMRKQKNNIRMRKYHRIQLPGYDVQRLRHK